MGGVDGVGGDFVESLEIGEGYWGMGVLGGVEEG